MGVPGIISVFGIADGIDLNMLDTNAFFLGLILIVVGTGLLKPNISSIVGQLYKPGSSRRDAGFSIFYMGINIGALLSPLLTSSLAAYNWHLGFGLAGFGMVIGLVQYKLTSYTIAAIGNAPTVKTAEEIAAKARLAKKTTIGVGLVTL